MTKDDRPWTVERLCDETPKVILAALKAGELNHLLMRTPPPTDEEGNDDHGD